MIGLWGSDLHWQGILKQEGVSYTTDAGSALDCIRVLILDSTPKGTEASRIADYVESGGALLSFSGHAGAIWPDLKLRKCRLRYVLPDSAPLFRNVGIVDVETGSLLPEKANAGRTDTNRPALLVDRLGRGARILLPFDPAVSLSRRDAVARQFAADSPRYPTEAVSRVGRGEVRRLVAGCLRFLLAGQGLPYVHLSYVPGPGPSLLGFRVDTDCGPESGIEATARLADDAGMKFSWYVNTGSHGRYLGLFRNYVGAGHDIQLHCHRHMVFPDYARNRTNLHRGKTIMEDAGLPVVGTVAPYGDWNPEFDRAVAELGFSYSSEFSYDYDDLPCRPVLGGDFGPVLQVPVHPVSLGRLAAAHADDDTARRYYAAYVTKQCHRREPCLLYDHPERIARSLDVLRDVLRDGMKKCGSSMTLTDYAQWWVKRESLRYAVSADANGLNVATDTPGNDVALVVEYLDKSAELPLQSGAVEYDRLRWKANSGVTAIGPTSDALRRTGPAYLVREFRRKALKRLQERRE